MADRAPVAVGVNVTLTEQLACAARLGVHVVVRAKSAASIPAIAILVMLSVVAPTLVSVTVCGALVVPTVWLPKFKLAGENFITVPVPARETVCGLPGALSVTSTLPISVPETVGLKTTVILQLAPAATLAPQLLIWVKSPVTVTLATVSAEVPVFVRIRFFCLLDVKTTVVGNVRLVGEKLIPGPPVPVPLRATVCGLLGAVSAKVRVAVRAPMLTGEKLTLTTQLVPEATIVPHVLVSAKSPGFDPVIATLSMPSGSIAGLLIIRFCRELVLPTG